MHAGHQDRGSIGRFTHHSQAIFFVEGQGEIDPDVLASAQGGDHQVGMRCGWRTDRDRIESGCLQELFHRRASQRNGKCSGHFTTAGLIHVRHHDNFNPFDHLQLG